MTHQERILEAAAKVFEVKPSDIRGGTRPEPIISARQACVLLLSEQMGWSSASIGRFIVRCSSAIRRSLPVARNRRAYDGRFRARFLFLEQMLSQT